VIFFYAQLLIQFINTQIYQLWDRKSGNPHTSYKTLLRTTIYFRNSRFRTWNFSFSHSVCMWFVRLSGYCLQL